MPAGRTATSNLDQLDQSDANPPAFAAAVHCFELLKAETLVGSPEAQERAPRAIGTRGAVP